MKLTTKQLKQIIAEELRSILGEQRLGPWLASQGVTDEEMAEMYAVPGWTKLMNMLREFDFQKIESKHPNTIVWQRAVERDDGQEVQSVILQRNVDKYRIATQGPWRVSLRLSGENWADHPGGKHIISYKDNGMVFAAGDIPYIIEVPEENSDEDPEDHDPTKGTTPGTGMFTNLLEDEDEEAPEVPKSVHRARQLAGMMMAGEAQFETVANYIRMGVVPMEDIQKAIVEKYNETIPKIAEWEHIVKAGYDSYADPYAFTDVDAIRKANHEIEILKIPFYNVFQFWSWAVDPDTGKGMARDIKEEVDKLLDIKELYKLVPGLQYYAHGGEGSGFEDPFFEHMISEEIDNILKGK